jgi:hypothetical protein
MHTHTHTHPYTYVYTHPYPPPTKKTHRKHFDPFAAAFSAKSSFTTGLLHGGISSKRGKPAASYLALSMAAGAASGDGMPRAMRDVEARRAAEDAAGKVSGETRGGGCGCLGGWVGG